MMVCALVQARGLLRWRFNPWITGATGIQRELDVSIDAVGAHRYMPVGVDGYVNKRGGHGAELTFHAVLAIASTRPVRRSWLRCTLMHDCMADTSPIR